jgi:hypothetical protein
MSASLTPLHDMMIPLHAHYTVQWRVRTRDEGYLHPGSFGHHLETPQLLKFLACLRSHHVSCSKEAVKMSCTEFAIWAAVMAYLSSALPHGLHLKDQEEWLRQWQNSRLAKSIRHTFEPYLTGGAETKALRDFVKPFWASKDEAPFDLFEHRSDHIRDADSRPPLKAHAFQMDSVLVLEVYYYKKGRDDHKALQDLRHPDRWLHIAHTVVVVQPAPKDALRTTVAGLEHLAGLVVEPLTEMTEWEGDEDENPSILGRIIELRMGPEDITHYQKQT